MKNHTERKPHRRGLVATTVLIAVAVHVIGLFVAGAVIVARYFAEPKAVFTVPPREIRVPVQTREHKMTMASHEAMAPKPSYNDRLVSIRPAAFALPEMPKVNLSQMLPLDPSEIISDQIGSLVGSGGRGSGMGSGGLGSGGMGGMGMSFFGIKTEGRRILLLFDVSGSVVNKANASGMPLARIKEETVNLVNRLPLNSRFGIVQFVRNYKPFAEELVVASPPNKEKIRSWIESEWNESGMMPLGTGVRGTIPNGLPIVLDFAFSLRPDTIFLISDGSFEQTTNPEPHRKVPADEFDAQLKRLQAAAGQEVPIHFIGFQMKPEDQATWQRLTQRNGGRLRTIK